MRYHEILTEKSIISPAFRQWFGQSKVVDASGNPLRVYHGTHSNFTDFFIGSHFGDIEAANARLNNLGHNPHRFSSHHGAIMPVFLSIQHPLQIIDDGGLDDGYDITAAVASEGELTQEEHNHITATSSDTIVKRRLFAVLAQKGYDGFDVREYYRRQCRKLDTVSCQPN